MGLHMSAFGLSWFIIDAINILIGSIITIVVTSGENHVRLPPNMASKIE